MIRRGAAAGDAPPAHPVRRALDSLYAATLWLAAFFLAGILVLVAVQMALRPFAVTVPGAQDFAGYSVAATSFLALGPALRAGYHVRVGLLLQHVGPTQAWWLEVWCCAVGGLIAGYLAYWSADLVWDSYQYGEVASTLVATPLWIPRVTMAFGALVLAVAFIDELVHVLRGHKPRYERQLAME